jgi:hypothetical protein
METFNTTIYSIVKQFKTIIKSNNGPIMTPTPATGVMSSSSLLNSSTQSTSSSYEKTASTSIKQQHQQQKQLDDLEMT